MNRKITAISATAFILGLFSQLIQIDDFKSIPWLSNTIKIIKEISPNINLSKQFYDFYFNTRIDINFLDLLIYILLLFGLIAYLSSKGKEIRLLRMTFSVLLIAKALSIFTFLIALLLHYNLLQLEAFSLTLKFISLTSSAFWLFFSFYVITNLSNKVLLQEGSIKGNSPFNDFIDTPKSQRFFHHIFDLILSVVICSKFVYIFLSDFLEKVKGSLGEMIAIYILIIISRLLYLILFEFVFKATPAKFLTGSRVIMNNGDPLNFKSTLFRNISRHVPFETFSYIGRNNGWHDQWTNTRVVKEINMGVPAKKYLWIILIFLIIGVLSYVGYVLNDINNRYISQRAKYEQRINTLEQTLKKLSDEYFLELNDVEDKWENGLDTYYLKVENVKEESVVFKYFKMDESGTSINKIEKFYEKNKNGMSIIEVKYDDLNKSLTRDYDDFKNMDRHGYNFIPDKNKYYLISNVYRGYSPHITLLTTGRFDRETIQIELKNDGWPASLIKIENIEGDLNWLNELPEEITVSSGLSDRFSLKANNFKYGKLYSFQITISDALGRKEKFKIEGVNSERTMTKIEE